jgi:hypothetical protein
VTSRKEDTLDRNDECDSPVLTQPAEKMENVQKTRKVLINQTQYDTSKELISSQNEIDLGGLLSEADLQDAIKEEVEQDFSS